MNGPLTDLQQRTLEVIMARTKLTPITGIRIALAIGLKDRESGKEGADLRSIVHALRVKGYPICASGRGYYWPADGDELHAFIESLQRRADELQGAIDGLGAGYSLVGVPGAIQAAKKGVVRRYMDLGKVFEVAGINEDRFLAEHPNAQLV